MRQPPYGVLLVSAVVLVMIVAVVAIVSVKQPIINQEINDENVIGNVAYPGAYNSPNGLRGYLDIGTRTRIAGWSYDVNAPTQPVTIEILVNNVVVDSFPTFQVRQDVNNAFGITGAHGFDIETPQASLGSRVLIRAVRTSNGDITELGMVRITGFGCTACTESTCADDQKLRRCVNGCYQPTTLCPALWACVDGACQDLTPPMTGTLTASPNPCTVPTGQTQCTSTLSWTSAGDAYTHVQVWNPTGVNVSCTLVGQAGTLIRQVAVNQPKTFHLYPATSCLRADADTGNELANVTITAVSAAQGNYNATFVSLDVPRLMITGQTYTARVTMRNTGTSNWVGGRVSLDAVNIDAAAWTPTRVFLPAGVTVPPGQQHTFVFSVTASVGKSMRLFSWSLRSVDLQRYFGQGTPTTQGNHTWIVTDTPYGTNVPPVIRSDVDIWAYIIGDPTTKSCLTANATLCQTVYPQGANHALIVRDGAVGNVRWLKSDVLNTIGVDKDGTQPGLPDAFLRCLTRTRGVCDDSSYPMTPLVADLPVLPASAINRHLITEEGLDVQMKQTFWWNPIDRDTCQPTGTAGSITGSSKLFLLDSYDFGGDVGVQQDVLVLENVAGYPTDAPMAQLDPWGTMRLERYLFVEGKGFYQSDGIEDPDCRDNPSVQTCNGVYSRFFSFEPTSWRWIKPTPVPFFELCPNL